MIQKDASYHASAVRYNEGLAVAAEAISKEVEHEEVAKWSRSVAKQHRFHENRHRKALGKIEAAAADHAKRNPNDVKTEDDNAPIEQTVLEAPPAETPAPKPTAPVSAPSTLNN